VRRLKSVRLVEILSERVLIFVGVERLPLSFEKRKCYFQIALLRQINFPHRVFVNPHRFFSLCVEKKAILVSMNN